MSTNKGKEKNMNNPHKNAVKQLESVAKVLEKEYTSSSTDKYLSARFQKAIEKLKTPDNVFEGELAVKMDNGKTKKFKAYRSQHNDSVGPYKGGIRFHEGVTKEEVMALSTWMTWKCSVTGLPYGGGKGGVVVNPRELSHGELERLSRAYARFVAPYIGAWVDVPAPDVNTDGQIMAWMVDEYHAYLKESHKTLHENPIAAFTGKPILLGGSKGRTQATGLGGFHILEKLTEKMGWKKKNVSVAVQGFGNVGYYFAQFAYEAGYKVVALSDSKGALYNEKGLNPIEILAEKQKGKKLSECAKGKAITNEELLELGVDVLVPAALENVIHEKNAANIKAKVVLELANGPTTPEAEEVLVKKDILVIPDVLANAGGVTVSYFEWVQNLHGYYWEEALVLERLKTLMDDAFERMWGLKTKNKVSGRIATYMSAVKKVVDTMMLRGVV